MTLIFNSYSTLSYLWRDIIDIREITLTINSCYLYPFPICLSIFVFHLRHSKNGADFLIFNLFLSFSYYLFSLSIFILQNSSFKRQFRYLINNRSARKKSKEHLYLYDFNNYILIIYITKFSFNSIIFRSL